MAYESTSCLTVSPEEIVVHSPTFGHCAIANQTASAVHMKQTLINHACTVVAPKQELNTHIHVPSHKEGVGL